MHRLFEKLKPAFFRAWDQKLLINRPGLWATKFHYALVFGLLGLALSSLSVWLLPIELSAVPNAWNHLLYAAIPSAIGVAIWIWQVSLFKTDKAFGEAGTKVALRDQLIYGLIVLMAVMIPALYGYGVSQKVARSTDEPELIADIEQLNLIDPLTYNYPGEGQSEVELIQEIDSYHLGQYRYYAFDDKLIDRIDKQERLVDLLQPQSLTQRLSEIEQYLLLLNKYSQTDFTISAVEIDKGFWAQEGLHNPQLDEAQMEARENLMLIQESLTDHNHLFGNKGPLALVLLSLWGLGLLVVGLQSSGRSFLISAVLGGVILAGGVMLAGSLGYFLGIVGFESWLSIFHLLAMLLLGLLVLRRKTTQKGILWRQVVLTLFVVGLAFLPMSIWQMGLVFRYDLWFEGPFRAFHRDGVFEYLLLGGALLPLLLWNLGLRQSFIRLHVRPKTR